MSKNQLLVNKWSEKDNPCVSLARRLRLNRGLNFRCALPGQAVDGDESQRRPDFLE